MYNKKFYTNADVKVRFRYVSAGTNFENDCGIDNVRIYSTARGSAITLAEHGSNQVSDQFGTTASVSDVLLRFKLTGDDSTQVTALDVNYTTAGGIVDGDVTSGMLYEDDGTTPGIVDGSDTRVYLAIPDGN